MKWHQRLGAAVTFAMLQLLSILPLRMLYWKAGISKWLGQHLIGYRRQVVIQNLSRAFPEANYQEINQISRDFYKHFFNVFAEIIKSASINKDEVKRRFLVTNPDLVETLHSAGKNTIILSGHTGNWEYMKFLPYYLDFPCYILYKPLSNKLIDMVTNRMRLQHGVKLLAMNQAARFILSKKDFPAMYVFLSDQSPHHLDSNHIYNFLNQPSYFFTGGVKIARSTKSALLYLEISRIRRGNYSATYRLISEDAAKETEQELMQKYVNLLEDSILAQPASWLWSHKRWKHQPE
ncbi:MAG: lysophospholipid acyltransferase family protein [Lentimicrobium sp.]|jgi:KDO2-lipid IV(A) lauroyltransferase|nr:lysophospholipid acyltransferase family protein [Lentimicrobium sp.]